MRHAAAFFLAALLLASGAEAAEWKEKKSDHFIVYYAGADEFAGQIARQAEVYYDRIASDLGYPRYSNFWQWENRVKIYVYPTKEEFLKASGQPEWSEGMADYTNKRILTYAWSEHFTDALLPHELTHLIFRDFVGFKGEVPLWIDEGVAQWEEPMKRQVARQVAAYLFREGKSYALKDLTAIGQPQLAGMDAKAVEAFYMQSVTLVDFLVRRQGPSAFTAFCRSLRDGKALNDALRSAYPPSLSDLDLLEKAWKKDVMETEQKGTS